MRTLVGTIEPSNGNRPVVLIVDSTPEQRVGWDEQCQLVGVRHHFADVKSALRRLADEEFPVVGVVLDRDRNGERTVTADQLSFMQGLQKQDYKGPLVGANLVQGGHLQIAMGQLAEKTGWDLLLDDGPEALGYAEMLAWCLDH